MQKKSSQTRARDPFMAQMTLQQTCSSLHVLISFGLLPSHPGLQWSVLTGVFFEGLVGFFPPTELMIGVRNWCLGKKIRSPSTFAQLAINFSGSESLNSHKGSKKHLKLVLQ